MAARGGSDHAVVNLRRRQLRTLRGIERDLAGSSPGLDALFQAFARRTYGLDLRWVETMSRRPMLARLRQRYPGPDGSSPDPR